MTSSFETKRNRILLKPRFQIYHHEQVDRVMEKFRAAFSSGTTYRVNMVDQLIVINVPKEREHFWSPQLQLQLEEQENQSTLIRGHYGPQPNLWTLFMFIHFGVAVIFAIFATMLFTDLSLGQDVTISLGVTIAMPVLWVLFYLFGRWGKMKGKGQIQELDGFIKAVLQN